MTIIARFAYLLPVAMISILGGIAIERAVALDQPMPSRHDLGPAPDMDQHRVHICAAAERLVTQDWAHSQDNVETVRDVQRLLDCPGRAADPTDEPEPLLYFGWGLYGAGRELLEIEQARRVRRLTMEDARKLDDLVKALDEVASGLRMTEAVIEAAEAQR